MKTPIKTYGLTYVRYIVGKNENSDMTKYVKIIFSSDIHKCIMLYNARYAQSIKYFCQLDGNVFYLYVHMTIFLTKYS